MNMKIRNTRKCHVHANAFFTDVTSLLKMTSESQLCSFLPQGGVNLDDVGFEIVGGKDDPQFPNDNSIYVCMVNKSSPAYGKLK